MRKFAYLVTLSWHEGAGIHTRTHEGTYEAEAWETMTSIRDNIREDARIALEVPRRTEDAVLLFWTVPDEVHSE